MEESPLEKAVAHHLQLVSDAIEGKDGANFDKDRVDARLSFIRVALETAKQWPAMGVELPPLPKTFADALEG